MSPRLAPAERRSLIVAAAVPLFARRGFAGTTTRQIAEAAGVSEALVFKYFATKAALYDAIVAHCRDADPRFDRLQTLPASTATLVEIVCVVTEYFIAVADHSEDERARHRLFLRSLLEDGEFAQVGLAAFAAAVQPMFERSLAAAVRAGHLITDSPDPVAAFWSMTQMQLMIGSLALPGRGLVPEATLDESVQFILRGIGVKNTHVPTALARKYIAHRSPCETAASVAVLS